MTGSDTIAAISTALGQGAIALIRVSGPEAIAIAGSIFRGKTSPGDAPPRTAIFGAIHDAHGKLDEVLLTVFRAPHSFTGEDVVEIACHGGVLVTQRILELLLQNGARSAEPGEFTLRAFTHGKLDLTQAEAIMDLISAQTDLALRAANEQLEGRLGDRIRALRGSLLELLAHIEAYIDFPDEDIDPDTGAALLARIDAALADSRALLGTAAQGRILREGVRTVICGQPNVGKSSLLNVLLGFDRAIVSAIPGTTRDTIEEVINLRGFALRLVDTAGLRESPDAIEREGMQRTRHELDRADLILEVAEAPAPRTPLLSTHPDRTVLVLNKADLGMHESWRDSGGVAISCLRGENIDALSDAMLRKIQGGVGNTGDWSVAINARHQACLQRALQFLEAARRAFTDGLSPEFIAEELRAAMDAVGEIVGRVDTEELLGSIFARFCIGK